jgi:hypothetical protein
LAKNLGYTHNESMSVTTWFRQQPCFGTLASLSTESLPRARRYWCTVWVTEAGGEPCF